MSSNIESGATVPILDLEIRNTEGVGPTTAKKLKEAWIVSVMALAVTSSEDLSVDLNSSKESVAAFIIELKSS
jgi:DNA repair protein RadA